MVDPADIVSIVLRGALGRSGRKRASRARNFLSGHSGFLSASALMAAAGIAWGVYDSMKSTTVSAATGGSASAAPPPVPVPPLPTGVVVATADGPMPFAVLRLVRLAVSAARADGTLSAQERELILQRAREAGVEHVVESELAQSRPLTEIVSGVADATQREELYVLAFTIVRADEDVTGAERIYLAQLAHQLGLDPATVTKLEQQTATAIDAAPTDEPSRPSEP
jgi:uncharacterized membrane protein YebE (DUF533 family)